MTKAKSKPCICCAAWNGACTKGWKPRFYKEGGLRQVCDDFLHENLWLQEGMMGKEIEIDAGPGCCFILTVALLVLVFLLVFTVKYAWRLAS